ncbi:MAG: magnesium chelatase [Chitinophagales bacterium]|jgi:magnesium chelatase subunit I|nr:magnesium chelatase [Chitinophagales bacterium]
MNLERVRTLGELKKTNYLPKPIKEEIRDNLIAALRARKEVFEGIQGYDESVIPQLHTAILSRHNIILLGLRGQAKTRLARLMVQLLDEYIPVVEHSEMNDDPYEPISRFAKDLIEEKGDQTPITWLHRDERYAEKLATPDVSVADLIGDVDPIKAATLKLPYSDERVIHYGIIPRSHRSIFVINELPDLQARIQVSLFNILQEGDIQIRGFKMRLPLDILFLFTANPEDYTNRGSIVTPLKDRIDSQILTHYPKSIAISRSITEQESSITEEQKDNITIPSLLFDLIEQTAFEARESDFIDKKSGVSARLTISALENLYSTIERRMLINKESKGYARVSDIYGILPSITGKVELVYEGEVEGIATVATMLIGKAIRKQFDGIFPNPEKNKKSKSKAPSVYADIINWFSEGNKVDILQNATQSEYEKALLFVKGLNDLVKSCFPRASKPEQLFMMEFALHGLSEFSQLSKHRLETGIQFKDLLGSMMNFGIGEGEEEGSSSN